MHSKKATNPGSAEKRPAPLIKKSPQHVLALAIRTVLTGAILLLASLSAAQISPGPLSHAHRTLNGTTHCVSCHKLGGGEATFKCLDCHTEISSRLTSHRGLHASYGLKPGSSQECVRCHSEHNGEDFSLLKWTPTPAGFDHTKTGYNLTGKHSGLACSRCHSADHVAPSEKLSIQVRDLNKTFLGVPQTCTACHKDEHNGRLGQNCQQCHNTTDWKNVSQFDHSKTRYPLTGLHAQVGCQKCHTSGPDNKPRYTGLPFGKCSDCHSDPHKGSFGQQTCQSCHNTNGWKRVSIENVNQKFDHSKTKYPLLGKHQEVDCLKCHAGGDFKKPLEFQKCASCHRPDPHGGQFAKRKDGGECASCHNVEGFKPSTYGVKEHSSSAYPLELKHATVECAKCHIPKGKDTLYRLKFSLCTDCHKDAHQAQFASAPYMNRCEQCHDLKGYRPSTFTLVRHKQTRFLLTGGHIATPCGDCHKERSVPGLEKAIVYKFEDRSCTQCHADPHKGQFKDRMLQTTAGGAFAGCEACHSTKTWKDLQRFDHAKTSFPLVGAHRATACADCHKPPNLETKLTNVDFKAAPTRCEQCHEDIHGGQFADKSHVTQCAPCHTTTKWKPSLFDHEKTVFSLKGGHQNVRCESCHKEIREVDTKQVLFYKPTPKECAACHGAKKS